MILQQRFNYHLRFTFVPTFDEFIKIKPCLHPTASFVFLVRLFSILLPLSRVILTTYNLGNYLAAFLMCYAFTKGDKLNSFYEKDQKTLVLHWKKDDYILIYSNASMHCELN